MSTHNHGSTNLSPQSHMDTPEGEISAIQSGRLQPLPTYTELDNSTEPLISTVDPSDTRHIPPTYTQDTPLSESKAGTSFLITDELPFVPIPVPERVHISSSPLYHDDLYGMPPLPDDPADDTEESRERRRQETVKSFFSAIKEGKEEVIDLFLTRNFVTANTIDAWGKTPLLAAVETRNMRTVQQLLDAGAEPDAFGVTVCCLSTASPHNNEANKRKGGFQPPPQIQRQSHNPPYSAPVCLLPWASPPRKTLPRNLSLQRCAHRTRRANCPPPRSL